MKTRLALLVVLLFMPQIAGAVCVPALTVNATTLNFGVYDPGAESSDNSTATISLQCAIGLLPSFTVALSTGDSGSYSPRRMLNGSSTLSYNLYIDQRHMVVWGDGTGATSTESFDSLLSLGGTNFTVYGSAPPGQYATPGTFADTITVTVTY